VSIDLSRLPRFPLAHLPTPLQEAARLREALGGPAACPRILIKRDDLTGLAFGGNKVRKLEFLVGDALARRATVLITAGAAQSNHARATAAAAVAAGLSSVLVLAADDPEPLLQGNLLLDRMLGAEIRIVPTGTDRAAAMDGIAEELTDRGETPYVIPVGGSNETGAAGYLTMVLELRDQLAELGAEPSRIYFASGSSGTQAGITLGVKALGLPCEPYAIMDSPFPEDARTRTLEIANRAAELVGDPTRLTEADFAYDEGYFGEAYGVPTSAGDEAIRLMARTEAIFLDPVYTGKALSGLIDHVRTGRVSPDQTVVFVHTGGNVAIFAHAQRMARISAA
jgi:D-cysteine desulfhydrase family pyridoxal phosphate-dependent enzyme